jgi:hypothetical protein
MFNDTTAEEKWSFEANFTLVEQSFIQWVSSTTNTPRFVKELARISRLSSLAVQVTAIVPGSVIMNTIIGPFSSQVRSTHACSCCQCSDPTGVLCLTNAPPTPPSPSVWQSAADSKKVEVQAAGESSSIQQEFGSVLPVLGSSYRSDETASGQSSSSSSAALSGVQLALLLGIGVLLVFSLVAIIIVQLRRQQDAQINATSVSGVEHFYPRQDSITRNWSDFHNETTSNFEFSAGSVSNPRPSIKKSPPPEHGIMALPTVNPHVSGTPNSKAEADPYSKLLAHRSHRRGDSDAVLPSNPIYDLGSAAVVHQSESSIAKVASIQSTEGGRASEAASPTVSAARRATAGSVSRPRLDSDSGSEASLERGSSEILDASSTSRAPDVNPDYAPVGALDTVDTTAATASASGTTGVFATYASPIYLGDSDDPAGEADASPTLVSASPPPAPPPMSPTAVESSAHATAAASPQGALLARLNWQSAVGIAIESVRRPSNEKDSANMGTAAN